MNKLYLSYCSPDELKKRIEKVPVALIPVGVVEWHGEHLPLGVDVFLVSKTCEGLAEATGCLIAPPIAYGISTNLSQENGYFGTFIDLRPETLVHLVTDVANSLHTLGFKKALIMSGHYEPAHYDALIEGSKQTTLDAEVIMPGDWLDHLVQETDNLEDTWLYAGDHAAEYETSLMLYHFGSLVDMESAPDEISLTMAGIPEYLHRRFPKRATAEYGKQLYEAQVEGGIKHIQNLLTQLGM